RSDGASGLAIVFAAVISLTVPAGARTRLLVAPRIEPRLAPSRGCVLPLLVRRQPPADPLAEGGRLIPADAVDGVVDAVRLPIAGRRVREEGARLAAYARSHAPLVRLDRG